MILTFEIFLDEGLMVQLLETQVKDHEFEVRIGSTFVESFEVLFDQRREAFVNLIGFFRLKSTDG